MVEKEDIKKILLAAGDWNLCLGKRAPLERDAPDHGQCCRSNAAVVVSDGVAASAHGALCAASAAPQAEFCVMFQGAKERET